MRLFRAVAAFANIVEIRTKVISMGTFFSAVLYSWYAAGDLSLPLLAMMTIAVLCVDMGTTAMNSFFDFVRGVDRAERIREGDKVLVKGEVPPGAALLISAGLYAAAAVLGIVIAVQSGIEVVVAGALCMAVGIFYNAGPLPLSSTPLGELFAGGFLGTVLFLITYYVFTAELTVPATLVSLPFTFYIASVLTVNNTCDAEGDAEAGRKTIVVLCGGDCGRALIYMLGGAAYLLTGWWVWTGILPSQFAYVLPLAAVAAIVVYLRMDRRGYSHATKGRNMTAIVSLFGLYSAAVIVSLGFALLQ